MAAGDFTAALEALRETASLRQVSPRQRWRSARAAFVICRRRLQKWKTP
jgi:hypothetical protein